MFPQSIFQVQRFARKRTWVYRNGDTMLDSIGVKLFITPYFKEEGAALNPPQTTSDKHWLELKQAMIKWLVAWYQS